MSNTKNKRDRDYVVGLLSGRTESRRNSEGEAVTVFVPKIVNKYQPLNTIFAKSKESEQEILIAEGVHKPLMIIDQSEFRKSSDERSDLKKLKAKIKSEVKKAGFNPKKRMNVREPVFIHWRAYD